MLVFVVGIERVEVYGVCVAISAFIHYFTLVTLMWMAAEALLMFQKLIIVFTQITTRYLVIVSLFCWRKSVKLVARFSMLFFSACEEGVLYCVWLLRVFFCCFFVQCCLYQQL